MKTLSLSFIAAFFLLAACNNSEQSESAPEAPVTEAPVTETPSEALVTLNAGDDMKFDLTEIRVKEGQTVKLTLHHTGKLGKNAMGHNFILLAQGVSRDDFVLEAASARDSEYIPSQSQNHIIAHTKLLGGGESDTIEFPAPTKGTYEFLCSFPGHAALMKGTFIVE